MRSHYAPFGDLDARSLCLLIGIALHNFATIL
jgi:hypothetical protein